MSEGNWWKEILKWTPRRQAIVTQNSSVSKPWAGIDDLPPELMEPVLDRLAEGVGDPAAASKDLANLRLVSRAARGFVDGDPLLRRVQLPSQVTELARDIAKSYPKSGLPGVQPAPNDGTLRTRYPISAGQHIAAVGPVLRFLPKEFRAKVVDDVRELGHPNVRADAILAIAKHSDFTSFSKPDRKFLVDDAIQLFGSSRNPLAFRIRASAEALAAVHEHISPEQHVELKQKWSGNPRLKRVFETRLQQRRRAEGEKGPQVRPRISSVEIKELQVRLHKISHSGGLDRILDRRAVERDRLPKIAAVAQALSDGVGEDYSKARVELQTRNEVRYGDRPRSRGR